MATKLITIVGITGTQVSLKMLSAAASYVIAF